MKLLVGLAVGWLIVGAGPVNCSSTSAQQIIKQVTVYHEAGRFAGWPANHGMWSWGNELLVGFSRGYHKDLGEARHNIDRERPEEFVLARSLDGGSTWMLEQPNLRGQLVPRGKHLHGTTLAEVAIPRLADCPGGLELTHPDFAMTLRMEDNDGGQSRFSYSYDRGRTWKGPFRLPEMGTPGVAARTDYLVDGRNEATFLLTAAKASGKEGRVFCARTRDGCGSFEFVAWVGDEIAGYEIMPSTVRISPTELLCATRVRQPEAGPSWIDVYRSSDNGASWSNAGRPVSDTGEGNPPSMIRLADGRVCLTYGFRAPPFKVCAKLSSDQGRTWGDEIVLRTGGGGRDIGYPCSVQSAAGNIVTVYYFWESARGPDRYIAGTLWRP